VEDLNGNRDHGTEMERLHNNPHDWIALSGTRIRSGLNVAFEYLSAGCSLAQEKMIAVVSKARKEHERLQVILREREAQLATLLADPSQGIIVTDDFHRVLVANQAALTLFGVSQKNINRFTIDAFLPDDQILDFRRRGLPFIRGTVRKGKCEIRRLDGSVRVVEFCFQAHFALNRHLSKFRDITR
jgi:PAS domain S-box-containing protein